MRGWLSRFSGVLFSFIAVLNVGVAALLAVQEQGHVVLPTWTAGPAGSTPTAQASQTGGLVPTQELRAPTEGAAVAAVTPTPLAAVIFVPPVDVSPSPVAPPGSQTSNSPLPKATAVPAAPKAPATSVRHVGCTRPASWVRYTVQKGDTLSSLARRLGTTVSILKKGNCLADDRIYVGVALWVPHPLYSTPTGQPHPTRTPTPRHSPTPAPTLTEDPPPTAPPPTNPPPTDPPPTDQPPTDPPPSDPPPTP
jgi:hypothetical protein